MPAKRARPPGLSDGTELTKESSSARTSAKTKSAASKNTRKTTTSTTAKVAAKPVPRAKSKPKPVENRIKVGVDFGTTNSGVAHVMSLKCDAQNVEVITSWMGGIRNNEQLEKVPSRIAFAIENADMDEDKWGYEVPPGARSYSWFKLLLDEGADRTIFDNEMMTTKMDTGLGELPENMSAEQVAVAYLSKLYIHTMQALEKRHTANIMKVTPIDFWLTVPATWQESAVDSTRTAAAEAGFGSRENDQLSIITEPEAAAIAVLSKAVDAYPEMIKVQTKVLMCDLGGGTLDFQLLTITKVKPQLETEETIPGIGGKSGSTYIDRNFHIWAASKFGEAFTKLSKQKIATGSKFMNDFEVEKKKFDGNLKQTFTVPLPALGAALRDRSMTSASYDFEEHCVLITGVEMADMFEPVVEKAFAIIDQISAKIEAEGCAGFQVMCLCGGLGSSLYVWNRFEQYKKEVLNDRCGLFTDHCAWSAVAKGGAIRGLSGSLVLSKRAKRAYGIAIHQAFREGVDVEQDAMICPVKGKRARGYACWPVEVGRRFSENMRVKTDLYITVPGDADEEDLVFKWKLLSCAQETLPEREDHDSVKKEGSITLDLRKSYKRSKRNDGSHDGHEAIKVAVVFKMGSERGTLMVEALHGTKVVGTARIDYARSHARQIVSQSAGLLDG